MAITGFLLYKISIESKTQGGPENFGALLEEPLTKYTALATKGHRFELDGKVRKKDGMYVGTFCLVQTTELPSKTKIGGDPADLFQDEDSEVGIGHYTSFVYDPENDVIAVQTNRNGVSPNGLAYFFKRNYKLRDISLELIIDPEKIDQVEGMSEITAFEINIAKTQTSSFSGDSDSRSFKESMAAADQTDANVMRLYLSTGRGDSGSLKRSSVLTLIRSYLKKRKDYDVTKLEVRGRETENDKVDILDLINNKVVISVTLDKVRTVNRAYNNKLIAEVVRQYLTIRKSLDKYKVKAKRN